MKLVNQYLSLKNQYRNTLILIKSGNFYTTFADDALLLKYFFGYQVIDNKASFPLSVKKRNLDFLNLKNVSYVLVEYDDIITSNKTDNQYGTFLNEAIIQYDKERNLNELLNRIQYKIKINEKNYDKIWEYVNEL